MKSVYVETSIVSFLTAKISDNLVSSAMQKTRIDWWETQRHRFELVTSELVLEEASKGDPEAAKKRLDILTALPLVKSSEEAAYLAGLFIGKETSCRRKQLAMQCIFRLQ